MRKFIYFVFALVMFVSCEAKDSRENHVEQAGMISSTEYNGNCIEISGYYQGSYTIIRYNKCKINNHDYWLRVWQTKYDKGSDLKHFEDLCDYCSH